MSVLPRGFTVIWGDQTYVPISIQAHVKKGGSLTNLITWETECPSCAKQFTLLTGMAFKSPRRRCDACKAPGRKVSQDKKKFRKQIEGVLP